MWRLRCGEVPPFHIDSSRQLMDFVRTSADRTLQQGERLVRIGESFEGSRPLKLEHQYREFLIAAGTQLQIKAQAILNWDAVIGDDCGSRLADTAAVTAMLQTVRLTLETREILLEVAALFLSRQSPSHQLSDRASSSNN